MVDLRGKPPYLPPTHNYTEVMKMAIEKAFKYYGVDPNTHVDPALLSGKIVIIWLTQCTVFLTHILESQAFAYINQKYVPRNNEVYCFLQLQNLEWAENTRPSPNTTPHHRPSPQRQLEVLFLVKWWGRQLPAPSCTSRPLQHQGYSPPTSQTL